MSATKKKVHHALGIDFGTSNSYFSDVRIGGSKLSYTDLKFHNGQSSVPTCVLYEKKGEDWIFHSFGDAAIDLWKDLYEDERVGFRFRGGFKPDIAFDQQAYEDATAFFKSAKGYLEKEGLISNFSPAQGRQVVVGVPAQNVPGQEEKTREILEKVGIEDPVLIPEPEGALFYHLYFDSDRITIQKAHQGVLVVDFGGGTFDVAYLRDGLVQHHWGNPMLGGRLFDDLFFQWFLDMNGGEQLRDQMNEDGTLDYLRTFGFRKLKERFSIAWKNEQLTRFRERVTVGVDFDYGIFRGASIEAFHERAKAYQISQELGEELQLLEDQSVEALLTGKVDLLSMIQEQLEGRAEEAGFTSEEISAVILTGGSCRWPFLPELVSKAFSGAEMFQSPDPEATISRGLSLCFAFREHAEHIGFQMREDRKHLQEEIHDALDSCYQTFVRRVSEQFTTELYREQIRPIFESWRAEGGTIQELERQAEDAGYGYFEERGKQVIETEKELLQERIQQAVNDRIFSWLRAHGIVRTEFLAMHLKGIHGEGIDMQTRLGGVMDDFFQTVKFVIAGIVSVMVASIAGGSGVALLMSGPIGWLLGLILGAATTFLVLGSFDTKSIKLPPFVLKMAANDEHLEEAQLSFRRDIERSLMDVFHEKKDEALSTLNGELKQLIEEISLSIPVTAILQD